jgi:TP901 family phage tail tape measure protein
MPDRTIRVILTGSSAGAVKAFASVDAAAAGTESKLAKLKGVGEGMKSVGRSMTSIGLPMLALGGYAVKTAATFQSSMEKIHTQAGASQMEVARMSKSLQNIAPSVGTGPNELSQGLYHIESNGLRGANALKALRVAAEGAQVGGANLEDVTNALGAAIAGGVVKVGHYSQAMGDMNAAVGAGDMRMQDFADALGTGLLGPMKRYGVSLRSTSAALAVFGDNNIRGAEAGTRLASAIRIMAAPSAAASKALGLIGIGQTQLADDLRKPDGLVKAMTDLKTHLKDSGYTASQQALIITRAFGGRQSVGVQLMIGQLGRLQRKYADVGKGAGKFGQDWAATQKTFSFQFDKMKAAAETSMIRIGNALMPIVVKWLPRLAKAVAGAATFFSHLPGPVKAAAVGFALLLGVGGPILMFLGALVGAITAVGGALMFLAANPIILIIGAFVALGLGLVVLYERCKTFRDIVKAVFGAVASVVVTTVGFIKAHWMLLSEILLVPFTLGLSLIIPYVVNHFSQIVTFVASLPGRIARAASGIWDGLKLGLVDVINWVIRQINTITSAINSVDHIHIAGHNIGAPQIGAIGQIGTGSGGTGSQSGGGYRMSSQQSVGGQAGNSVNQTGYSATGTSSQNLPPIVLQHTTKLGTRVISEETVHYSARRTSLGGAPMAATG